MIVELRCPPLPYQNDTACIGVQCALINRDFVKNNYLRVIKYGMKSKKIEKITRRHRCTYVMVIVENIFI